MVSLFDKSDELGKNESVSNLTSSNPRMKKFMKHLMIASEKLMQVNSAKSDLNNKLHEMRSFVKDAPAKEIRSNFNDHVEELMSKVNYLVDAEKKILAVSPTAVTASQSELFNKISKLESELGLLREENSKIDLLTKTINELQQKISSQDIRKEEREKRMEDLEVKIRDRVEKTASELDEIESVLQNLSGKYDSLLKSGSHSEEELSVIKQRIDDLKLKLEVKRQ
ncbi:hypothetical protein JXM83_00790 [Candidatus Woesearchaeota archaeon]|nr:hypothetical protein [Candidatus Woesearchaeota archaeon]